MTRFSTLTTSAALTLATLLLSTSSLAAPNPTMPTAATPTQAAVTARTLSLGQIRADVTLARNAYKDIHPGSTRLRRKPCWTKPGTALSHGLMRLAE
jgi:hypothetical protein